MEENIKPSELSLIEQFKAKAQEFMQALQRLHNIPAGDVPENLQGEYSNLMGTAQTIQGTIGWITSTVDSVISTVSNIFGFNGVDYTRDYVNGSGNTGMGIVPLVPIAAITAGIAAMSKFISDVYLFERKVTEQKRLENTGMSRQEAADVVSQISDGNTIAKTAKEIGKPLILILGLVFAVRLFQGK